MKTLPPWRICMGVLALNSMYGKFSTSKRYFVLKYTYHAPPLDSRTSWKKTQPGGIGRGDSPHALGTPLSVWWHWEFRLLEPQRGPCLCSSLGSFITW